MLVVLATVVNVEALIVEAAELLEPFQWMTEDESRVLSAQKLAEVSGEAGAWRMKIDP